MSTCLTPSRIALLLLIKIYCEGFVPPESQLSVLEFITSRFVSDVHQSTERVLKGKRSLTNRFSLSLDDLRTLLSPHETKFTGLADPGRRAPNVWEILEISLCSIKNIDMFLGVLKRLSKHLTPADTDEGPADDSELHASNGSSRVSTQEDRGHGLPSSPKNRLLPSEGPFPTTTLARGSLFGIQIAQTQVELEKLKFEDAMKVWQEFDSFRRPLLKETESEYIPQDDEIAAMNAKSGGRMFGIIDNSLRQGDLATKQPISVDTEEMLEFQVHQMQRFGARVPESTRLDLRSIIGSAVNRSHVSDYASFLDAWYQGDYTSSFENLRRYYDYAMEHTDRSHYQYALLNMALLQADFGSVTEAVAAMKETIATARENKDMSCLTYCLSWLCQFEATHTGHDDVAVLNEVIHGFEDASLPLMYLKTAAREQGMPSIESQALLREAAICLANGHRPLEAFEQIYESSYLIMHYQLDDMKASQTLTQGSLYARLGATALASSFCSLVIDGFPQITLLEEMIHAHGQQCYILALAGKYDIALDALSKCQTDASRHLKCQQYLAQCVGIIKLKRALHHHDLLLAERLIATLKSSPSRDPALAFVVSLAEIDYHMRLENFSEAFDLIHAQFTHSKMDVYQRIRLLNAKVFLFAAVERPQKGFSISLRAATAAYRSKNASALWESVSAVVTVLNSLSEWDTAISLVDTSVYHATETDDAAVIAQLRSAGADSFMGRAKDLKELNDKYGQEQMMAKALRWVDAACEAYEKVEEYRAQYDMTLKAQVILDLLKDEEGVKARSEKLQKLEKAIYP